MTKKEARKTLIDCRALLKILVELDPVLHPSLQKLIILFEINKLITDLEDVMKYLDVIFVKEDKK